MTAQGKTIFHWFTYRPALPVLRCKTAIKVLSAVTELQRRVNTSLIDLRIVLRFQFCAAKLR